MLPQGMFSVAVATVLFPQLSRLAARRDYEGLQAVTGVGIRQIALLLLPAAAATLVLATPIVRLVYQRGEFNTESTILTSQALFCFAFSLPFNGWNLLLTRTFFALQKPWLPTALALASLVLNAAISFALYKPLGIPGVVIGTAISNAFLTGLEAHWLRKELGGLEIGASAGKIALMLLASAVLGRPDVLRLVVGRPHSRALAGRPDPLGRHRTDPRRDGLRRRGAQPGHPGGEPGAPAFHLAALALVT